MNTKKALVGATNADRGNPGQKELKQCAYIITDCKGACNMKREQLISFGIRADKLRAFMDEYWKDVHREAKRQISSQPDPAQVTREAITAMIGLIDDPRRLQMILKCTNRHYNDYTQEQPQKAQEGGAECP